MKETLIKKYAKYFKECPEDMIESTIENLINEVINLTHSK